MTTYKITPDSERSFQQPCITQQNSPPGSPSEGDRYLVGASPTGAWSGYAQKVAIYTGAAWDFYTPTEGWFVWLTTDNLYMVFDGSTWVRLAQKTQTMFLSAGGGSSQITSGCDSAKKIEMSTNKQTFSVLDFDPSTDENAQWLAFLPDSYDGGTITARILWTANSTSTNSVVWAVQARAYADNDSIDQSWGSAQTVTDANGSSAYTWRLTAATSAITIGGSPAGGQGILIRVYRDADNGSDTLAVDARLIGVVIEYGINVWSD